MERDIAELQRKLPDVENKLLAQLEQHKTQVLLRMDYLDKTAQDLSSREERTAKTVQKHDAQLTELENKMYGTGEEIPIPARIEEVYAAVKIVQEVQHKDLDSRVRMENQIASLNQWREWMPSIEQLNKSYVDGKEPLMLRIDEIRNRHDALELKVSQMDSNVLT